MMANNIIETNVRSEGTINDVELRKAITIFKYGEEVSKSEWNIVHKTLSQNNSSDVSSNVITELKDDEHIEPSAIDKGSSYFNIFE